jgi:hypothetical protein
MYRIRHWLSVGKYSETLLPDLLRQQGITAMLQLAAPVQQAGIESLYLIVDDGVPLHPVVLERGIKFGRAQKAAGGHLLVACGAGISRSSTFATAILKEEENLTLLDAFQAVHAEHPYAMPHPALWKSLCAYYGETTPFLMVWKRFRAVPGE